MLAAIKTPRRSENVRARTVAETSRTVSEVCGRLAEWRGWSRKSPRTGAELTGQARNCAGQARNRRVERVKIVRMTIRRGLFY